MEHGKLIYKGITLSFKPGRLRKEKKKPSTCKAALKNFFKTCSPSVVNQSPDVEKEFALNGLTVSFLYSSMPQIVNFLTRMKNKNFESFLCRHQLLHLRENIEICAFCMQTAVPPQEIVSIAK